MQRAEWGGLMPGQVADWINFDRQDAEWHYSKGNPISMPARQAEGVAGLWNTLASHDVALLADEVGMGKTFQALGVMALLWRMNPDARVLVMAPNRDICRHWMREYRALLRDHYREVDHRVRNAANGGAVHEPKLCGRLDELVAEVESGAGQFYLTTIHSLSGLVQDKDGNVLEKAEAAAQGIHAALKAATGGKGFDLIVVDEAHYFRNAHGHSQRARAARRFFGGTGSRLGQKALLMTATPSHSSLENVASILDYFADLKSGNEPPSPTDLLQKYALRRLRLMKGKEHYHSKYSYRCERAVPASFDDNPEAEMFFALYQKKLVQQQGQHGNKRGYLYGYLEGFESIGKVDPAEEQPAAEVSTQAFEGAADTQILRQLTQMHVDAFKRYPEHPKYSTLVQQCLPKAVFDTGVALHEHKHLVFVRRIPSVREITQRVNEAYDRLLAQHIVEAWQLPKPKQVLRKWEEKNWSREYFNRWISQPGSMDMTDAALLDEPAENDLEGDLPEDETLTSRIADLFVVKKVGRGRSTDCSNFSLRLRKPESLFSLLLEPASDYREGVYRSHYRKRVGERERDDYAGAALDTRLALHDSYVRKSELVHEAEREEHTYRRPMPTLWGLMYPLLPQPSRDRLDRWLDTSRGDLGIAENFASYMRTGFLFASPVIVELYGWFTAFARANNATDVQQRYLDFMRWLKPKLRESLALQYFSSALDSFEQICEKITDHALNDWQLGWRTLSGLQSPAWFASGASDNRQRLILGFNSPFYPNVLVATSVFQEGVNLHLQCRKVHHYGIAWTPGDNEQRVGRVDRLFGLVNRQLRDDGRAELAIHYPYLTRSFDQEQLASFVMLKHAVEARMDACRLAEFDDEIDIRNARDDWQRYLRKPAQNQDSIDPYPACFDSVRKPAVPYQALDVQPFDMIEHLRQLFASVLDPETDALLDVSHNDLHPGVLSLAETDICRDGLIRKQPLIAELLFSSELSSLATGTVYTLTLRSPLASLATLQHHELHHLQHVLDSDALADYPLVRLAMDARQERSHFYLQLRVDLPIFVLDGRHSHLSGYELKTAVDQLKMAADSLEWQLFGAKQDLRKEHFPVHHFGTLRKICGESTERAGGNLADMAWETVEVRGQRYAVMQQNVPQDILTRLAFARLGTRQLKLCAKSILQLSNLFPMLQFGMGAGHLQVRLVYPANDVQAQEMVLLRRWFDYVLSQAEGMAR